MEKNVVEKLDELAIFFKSRYIEYNSAFVFFFAEKQSLDEKVFDFLS